MSPAEYAQDILSRLPQPARGIAILGGGALRAFFDGTAVNDYDLFFRSDQDYLDARGALVAAGWSRELSVEGRQARFLAPDGSEWNLVGFDFGTPQWHVGRFDFRCCALVAWMEGDTARFHADDWAIDDCHDRVITVRNNNGTERTLKRIAHYMADYGYTLGHITQDEPEQLELFQEDADECVPELPDTLLPIGTAEHVARVRRQLSRCPSRGGGYP